jgi:non-ribosomal peptide synthetase component F
MVEHRGVVRLAMNNSTVRKLPKTPRMAHMSNLTFDASTWEVYAALLNGGKIICIDSATVLETDALGCLFRRERIDAAVITPTLLKQCWNTPLLPGLKVLHLVGEALAPSDAIKARSLVPGVVYNTYGPTENSVASTIYPIPKVTDCDFINGVPIGHAISNSGVYVLDQKQRLVPVGVIGELVVTGDGLARGYTDPSLDEGRFVQLTIGTSGLRAYRTGDLARWRFDGELEFQ